MRAERPLPSGFAAKATDLQALRDAVDQAATVSSALWITFLGVFFYLAIAAGAVTHKDLFFENPVKLPFLNVELPLTAFFVLGPLLFLIVHWYTLLHFAMLAGKVGAFHTELEDQVGLHSDREGLRRQLPSNIFVQILAGPRGVRTGVFGFMLRAIAWISLMIGPVALLAFFELQFLPYHDPVVTWWHRIAAVIDLLLLWVLWPGAAPITATSVLGRYFRVGLRVLGLTALSLLSLLLLAVATFRGEWLYDIIPPGPQFVPTSLDKIGGNWWDKILHLQFRDIPWSDTEPVTPYEFLVGGEVDHVAQRPKSWRSNRLLVSGIDLRENSKFDTEEKIASRQTTLSLRNRHLEDAVINDAYLPKADFTGAYLQGASLVSAKLQGASFELTQLQGASLMGAHLEGAALSGTWKGAFLFSANLQVARLSGEFQGATLDGAQLQGASFYSAFLQSASLRGASLQGAQLGGAQLQGASLDNAQLQGALLGDAQLQNASLNGLFIWRTDTSHIDAAGAYVDKVIKQPIYLGLDCELGTTCDWSPESYAALRRLITEKIPPKGNHGWGLHWLSRLDPKKEIMELSDQWAYLRKYSPTTEENAIARTEMLREIGCKMTPEAYPYVVHGLIEGLDIRYLGHPDQAARMADAFLNEGKCPGARRLSEKDKARLRKIRDLAPPSPTAPAAEAGR